MVEELAACFAQTCKKEGFRTVQYFYDGLAVAALYWKELLGLSLSGLGFGALVSVVIGAKQKDNQLKPFTLLLGWVFIGLVVPILVSLGALDALSVYILFCLGVFVFLVWAGKNLGRQTWRKFFISIWLPLTLFVIVLILRLAYIKDLLLPPYTDSPIHDAIVRDLLGQDVFSHFSLEKISNRYYHFGVHSISTWLSILLGEWHPGILAFVGQYFLAVLPVGVYFWILGLTGSVPAALISSLFAAFGWQMPAHAANWGKYPALVGIALLPAFLGVFDIGLREKNHRILVLTVVVAAGLIWIHSRIAVLILIFGLAHLIMSKLRIFLGNVDYSDRIVIAGFISAVLWIMTRSGGPDYLRYYTGNFWISSVVVIFLLMMSFIQYLDLSLRYILVICLIVLGTLISLPVGLQDYGKHLIDQPFFEISIFLPLAALVGIGVKTLSEKLRSKPLGILIPAGLILFLIVNAFKATFFIPFDETNTVREDDLFAISWAGDHLPDDSLVVIPALQSGNHWLTLDAGGWITSLTNRQVVKVSYDFEWDSDSTVLEFCRTIEQLKPVFIYSGSSPYSFQISRDDPSGSLDSIFYLPGAQIFQLSCQFDG